jgi:hypothetical protein
MFSLTDEDEKKIQHWLKTEVFPPIIQQQKQSDVEMFHVTDEHGVTWPYEGAIGGSLTYCFTPTSLGTVVVVRHSSGAELDLTNFDNW